MICIPLKDRLIRDVVQMAPDAEDVLEDCGIDYWFGGEKTLAAASLAANVDVTSLVARLHPSMTRPPQGETIPAIVSELLAHLESSILPAIVAVRTAATSVMDPRIESLMSIVDGIDAMTAAHAVLLRMKVVEKISAVRGTRIEQHVVRDLALQHALLAARVAKVSALASAVDDKALIAAVRHLAKEIHHHIRISYQAVMPHLFRVAVRRHGAELS